GDQTTWQFNGLVDGMPYYFVVRAYNTFGTYSGPSIEVSKRGGVPFSVRGDFGGDRSTEITVYRPSSGSWWVLNSGTGFATAQEVQWGIDTDIPVPADYDGDGKI